MKITVHYWAQIKQAAGTSSEVLELEAPCRVQDLVTQIAATRGEPFRSHILDGTGTLRRNILIIVGESHVRWDMPRELQDGDVVTLVPPISGG